jgi:type VI protein secretion system component VasF
MAQPVLTPHEPVVAAPSAGAARTVAIWGGAGLAVLGAVALWLHYGATVFFEMIASGISSCF